MNIWLSLDVVENKNVDDLKSLISGVSAVNGKDYEVYFKVYPTSIGTKVVFVCDELHIEQDVTNYNNW